jgi:1-acyl-sn-glycerol-3-phosphate acyltransferase
VTLPRKIGAWYWFASSVSRPVAFLISKREWRGRSNIPKTGPAIVIANHISMVDPLLFAHFVFMSGRAPKVFIKSSLFKVPFLGKIFVKTGQLRVPRDSQAPSNVMNEAKAAISRGELVSIYPEGTITREPNLWPMQGKHGAARLALETKVPVIPCAQWGAQKLLPPYSKKFNFFPRPTSIVHAGPPADLSRWQGREITNEILDEVTEYFMALITSLLEPIRNAKSPVTRYIHKK